VTGPGLHEALPVRGTLEREADGAPVQPAMPWDYPLTARCAPPCGQVIRKDKSIAGDWEHVR
jgi:hypothetical protein